ncbi:hypothetical protein [Mesorhizobium sp. B2-1-3A]|nr:hypothetical protein [Mesorhizobium sp. B2-1-3A]
MPSKTDSSPCTKGDTMKVLEEMIVLNGCLQEQLEALNAPSVGKRYG